MAFDRTQVAGFVGYYSWGAEVVGYEPADIGACSYGCGDEELPVAVAVFFGEICTAKRIPDTKCRKESLSRLGPYGAGAEGFTQNQKASLEIKRQISKGRNLIYSGFRLSVHCI